MTIMPIFARVSKTTVSMAGEKWTREQTIIALSVYCKIPFNKATNNNPEIVKAAKLIGRTPVAVKMKVGNFGSFDPLLKAKGIVGLSNTSKLDELIWNEYCNDWEKLAFDSAQIIANLSNQTIEEANGFDVKELPKGKERERIVKQRVNQSFFRDAVLASYNNKCCVTGLSCTDLLEACHIANWSEDIENRLNPSNGICLNVLFHKAYDKHYIGISPDYEVFVSEKLFDECVTSYSIKTFFEQYHKTKIHLPEKFLPDKNLLSKHFENYLKQ